MKHLTLLALTLLLVISSCRKKVFAPPYESPREERCIYQPDMKIDSIETVNGIRYGVAAGGNIIAFQYSNMWGWSDNVSDNEYFSTVWFPVEPEMTNFSYTDGQLKEHLCYYTGGGAWGGYGWEALEKGIISGTKNADGSWEISIDITLKGVDQQIKTAHIVKKGTFREGQF